MLGQVAGCASSSTSSVMMSLLAVGSRMDDIALNEVSNDRADALREAATNLQLAGWVLGQLQDTVNTFCSEVCGISALRNGSYNG